MKYDLIVIGSGPGGYVAAIRASQLGFKVGVVEKNELGGICLNWGCIPTKSLLKNAEIFDQIKNHGEDFGITADGLEFDFTKIVKRSRDISDRISKNVEMLVKKNKVDPSRVPPKTVLNFLFRLTSKPIIPIKIKLRYTEIIINGL